MLPRFPVRKIFISTGRAKMNLRFLLGGGKWTQMSGGKIALSQFQANWFSSQFAIPAKWSSVLLSFGLFPEGRLAIYSIALSEPYLNGAFPAERTLDLFVSKRIVFLWAYCSSLLRCGLLQIGSRNKIIKSIVSLSFYSSILFTPSADCCSRFVSTILIDVENLC